LKKDPPKKKEEVQKLRRQGHPEEGRQGRALPEVRWDRGQAAVARFVLATGTAVGACYDWPAPGGIAGLTVGRRVCACLRLACPRGDPTPRRGPHPPQAQEPT